MSLLLADSVSLHFNSCAEAWPFDSRRLCWIGSGEVIGQIGRLCSSQNNNFSVAANNYFLVQVRQSGRFLSRRRERTSAHWPLFPQIICLTISPAFFSAACYGIFTIMITMLSDDLSRIRSKWLVIMFVTADLVSLVLQAAGGVSAFEGLSFNYLQLTYMNFKGYIGVRNDCFE